MRTRYYRPDLRRFINADILTGSIDDSDTLNQYAYVEGNSFSMIDPFGMCAEPGSGTKSKSIVQKLKGIGKSIKKGYKKFADAWDVASGAYAEQVSGKVYAVVGNKLRPGNIWENVELSRLKNNTKVTSITTIDPKTGSEKVIFRR